MKKIFLVGLTVSALTLSFFATYSHSQEMSAEELAAVYENRSEFMKGMGGNMKAFSNFLKRGEGEPMELGAMAGEMAANAEKIPDLFPMNTGMAENEESEAKANIWTEWDDFVQAANNLAPFAAGLEDAFESGDPGNIGAAVKKLGGEGCRGCHNQFREKKD